MSRETELQLHIEKLEKKIEDMHTHYKAEEHKSSLKGWAIDRAIRIAEVNKDQGITFESLQELSGKLVAYCSPEEFKEAE